MALQLNLVYLVLLAAVSHAVWNAIVKISGDRFLTATAVLGSGTVAGVFFVPLVPMPSPEMWPYLIASVAIHAVYHLVLINAYRFGDLTQVYPLARGSAPLLVAVLAALTAGEIPGAVAMAGIALVSLGIISLSFERRADAEHHGKSVVLALATGFLISVYTVVDGLGIRLSNSLWSYIVWLMVLEGVPFLAWTALRRRHTVAPFLRREWKRALAGGVLSKLAYGCVLYALASGAMAHVSALRETSVLFAAVIGTVMLKERFGARRIIAAAVIAAGIITMQMARS